VLNKSKGTVPKNLNEETPTSPTQVDDKENHYDSDNYQPMNI
jgi:hypothetical protein